MDKNSYALGMSVAHNMRSSGVKDLRAEDFAAGLKAVLEGGPTELSWEEASQVLDRYFTALEAEKQAQQAEVADAMKAQGKAFLEQNAKAEGVTTLPSGLQYKVLKPGSGRKPGPSDRVRCHYEGTFIDGQVFDSSYRRGEPAVQQRFHVLMNRPDAVPGFVQVRLGKDQVQRGRRGADPLRHFLPALFLGCILIAGDHRPFFKIGAGWQQKIRRIRDAHVAFTSGVFFYFT